MDIVTKTADALIRPADDTDDNPDGAFEIVLSTGAKDRDGEEVLPDEWELPLPAKITMDADHGMSVDTTVGSGVPSIEDGKLIVRGTYTSLPQGQKVRTLVKEGHLSTTSVAFLRKVVPSEEKDAKPTVRRELLNGAFTPVPANTEAVVLASKGLEPVLKVGARNNSDDAGRIQQAHDLMLELGAQCTADGKSVAGAVLKEAVSDKPWSNFSQADYTLEQWKKACIVSPDPASDVKEDYKLPIREPDGTLNSNAVHAAAARIQELKDVTDEAKQKAAKVLLSAYKSLKTDAPDSVVELAGKAMASATGKAVQGSLEDLQSRLCDAVRAECAASNLLNQNEYCYAWIRATFLNDTGDGGTVVYCVEEQPGTWQDTFTDDGFTCTLGGNPVAVSLTEVVRTRSVRKPVVKKDFGDVPVNLISAVDAAIDAGLTYLENVDVSTLPLIVQQALSCFVSADAAMDKLMPMLGVTDPDAEWESEDESAADPTAVMRNMTAVTDQAAEDAAYEASVRVRAAAIAAEAIAA